MSAGGSSAAVRVAVVVPAYNAERFVARAIACALGQTLGDVHVVVVDDGSTDGTVAAARSVRDPRVTVVSTPNQGAASARNAGAAAAPAAPYVAFLDSDDEWDAGKLEAQVRYLDAHPDMVAVGCLMRYLSTTGRPLAGATGQELGDADQRAVARGELLPFPLSSIVVRRSAFDAAAGFDPCFRHAGAEDLDLMARLANHGLLACVPQVLGSYRIHPSSAMARHRARINAEARFVRQRLAARADGRDLTWADFAGADRRSLGEQWQTHVESLYRGAAVWYSEGRIVRSLAHLALAALIGPRYTLTRLYRQQLGRGR